MRPRAFLPARAFPLHQVQEFGLYEGDLPEGDRLMNRATKLLRKVPGVVSTARRIRRWQHERTVRALVSRGNGRAQRYPRGFVYEATMRCNLRCEFCYVGELLNVEGQWQQELRVDSLRSAIPDGAGIDVSLTGGEVFMRKDMEDVLDLFRAKGYTCGYLTTNGTLIDDRRAATLAHLARTGFLKHVSVSIDGPRELHDLARGVNGTFERAAAGLRRLREAAKAAGARLRISINTTISNQSLQALERMPDVAAELGVSAIGVNHLMFASQDEVQETARLLGVPDQVSAISTFVASGPGVEPGDVRAKLHALRTGCHDRGIAFDVRPKVADPLMDRYYTPNAVLEGRCLYPFLHARIGFSGKVYFCPFIRIEVGDLTAASLEEVWNNPTYVELRRRLLDQRLFPVCRRCCKVELREPA